VVSLCCNVIVVCKLARQQVVQEDGVECGTMHTQNSPECGTQKPLFTVKTLTLNGALILLEILFLVPTDKKQAQFKEKHASN